MSEKSSRYVSDFRIEPTIPRKTDQTKSTLLIDYCAVEVEVQVELRTRTSDGTSWTDWNGPYINPDGSAIEPGYDKYIQYEATFKTLDITRTPVLREVRISYT